MDRITKGVKRASSSSYEITFTYQGETCRERIKLKPNAGNDLKAKRFKHAVDQAIEDGTFDYTVTFPKSKKAKLFIAERNIYLMLNYFWDWLEKNESKYSASTFKAYCNTIKNIFIPEIGSLYIDELKRYHIKLMCKAWTVTPKTISTRLSLLRKILDEAVEDELIEKNPLFGWSYKSDRVQVTPDPINPFSKDEAAELLGSIQCTAEKNIIQTLLATGMRPSEAVAIQWTDVNFSTLTIEINKAQTDAAKKFEATKTKKSTRIVKILPPCLDALRSQRQITGFKGDHVFINPRTEKPWTPSRLYKIFTRRQKEAGLPHRKLEQTRHTYASMMLSAGESVMWVANQLGHSDWVMVGRIYAKWIPDADPNAGSKGVSVFWD